MEIKNYLKQFIPQRDSSEQDFACPATTFILLQSFRTIKDVFVQFLVDDMNDSNSTWTIDVELQTRDDEVYHESLKGILSEDAINLLQNFVLADLAIKYQRNPHGSATNHYSLINDYIKFPQIGDAINHDHIISLILDKNEHFTVDHFIKFTHIDTNKYQAEFLKWFNAYCYAIITAHGKYDFDKYQVAKLLQNNPIDVMIGRRQGDAICCQDWNASSVLILNNLIAKFNADGKYIHCKNYDQINWLYFLRDFDKTHCISSEDVSSGIHYITFRELVELIDEAIINNGGNYDIIRSLYED